VPICASCGQDNPDPARFCLACGTPLAPAAPHVEERKLIKVLFTDIVGSTAKAEQMDPEDVRARLAPYYTRLRSELDGVLQRERRNRVLLFRSKRQTFATCREQLYGTLARVVDPYAGAIRRNVFSQTA
jgi:hypothetical protein